MKTLLLRCVPAGYSLINGKSYHKISTGTEASEKFQSERIMPTPNLASRSSKLHEILAFQHLMNTGPGLTRLIHIHSFDNGAVWSFMASFQATILWNEFETYAFRIIATCHSEQWVNVIFSLTGIKCYTFPTAPASRIAVVERDQVVFTSHNCPADSGTPSTAHGKVLLIILGWSNQRGMSPCQQSRVSI